VPEDAHFRLPAQIGHEPLDQRKGGVLRTVIGDNNLLDLVDLWQKTLQLLLEESLTIVQSQND